MEARKRIHDRSRGLLAALFFCLAAVAAAANDSIGSLAYLEGDVTIVRNGEEVVGLAIGQAMQNFDLVKTGHDGAAEIDIAAPGAPHITVKVSADTQFSLELAAVQGKQQTTVGIIGGALSLKVAKLTGGQAMSVRTDSAVMGVRGTQFSVTAPATGDILITCDEGDVLCTNDAGTQLHAIPGSAVENRLDAAFRTSPVKVTDIAAYSAAWAKERTQALEKNALALIKADARLYLQLSKDLDIASADLAKSQAIVTKWSTEDKAGRVGLRAEIARERQAIGAVLARLRLIQFRMERVEYRLDRLRAIHDRGIGTGTIDAGMTTTLFFQRVDKERRDLQKKLAQARYLAKLYAKRNNGELP